MRVALVTTPCWWASRMPALMPGVRPRSSALTMTRFELVLERLWEMWATPSSAQPPRALRAPPQEVPGQGDGAEGGLRRERAEPRAGPGQGPFQRRDHGRAGLEGAAGQHHGIGLALEVERKSNGASGKRQLAAAALQ